jgi:hypothetical protein
MATKISQNVASHPTDPIGAILLNIGTRQRAVLTEIVSIVRTVCSRTWDFREL